jgi:hypothetical protein
VYRKILKTLELLQFFEFLTLEYKARPISQTVGMPTSSRKIPVPKYTTLLRSPGNKNGENIEESIISIRLLHTDKASSGDHKVYYRTLNFCSE